MDTSEIVDARHLIARLEEIILDKKRLEDEIAELRVTLTEIGSKLVAVDKSLSVSRTEASEYSRELQSHRHALAVAVGSDSTWGAIRYRALQLRVSYDAMLEVGAVVEKWHKRPNLEWVSGDTP